MITILNYILSVVGLTWIIDKMIELNNKRRLYHSIWESFLNDLTDIINENKNKNILGSLDSFFKIENARLSSIQSATSNHYENYKNQYLKLNSLFNDKEKIKFKNLIWLLDNSIKMNKEIII